MQITAVVLVLLLAVVVSGALTRMNPVPLPLPLVQIALGSFIASVMDLSITLDPDVFFLLFLPPLLFLDGWRIPKQGLLRDKSMILELALGLVIFTVAGVGFLVHLMLPSMPLAVAFALGAAISPTDPVAFSAIANRVPMPARLMHILEGESLLNDASGLLCMGMAVSFLSTGSFSLRETVENFLWLVGGGSLVGVAVTFGVSKLKNLISKRFGEEAGQQILISLLIPFGAYLSAEALKCSGILAAVFAGITMSYVEQSGQALAVTRVRRTTVWDTVQFVANGVIFVLLGEQLPDIVADAAKVVRETGHGQVYWLAVYVLAICLALVVLRFVWVWVALQWTVYRSSRVGARAENPSLRLVAVTSLAGVRGAVTLGAVLSLPLLLANGNSFPDRDLTIFLASGVIITSLIVAAIGLPVLLNGLVLPADSTYRQQEDAARAQAAAAAMDAIMSEQTVAARGRDAPIYMNAGSHLLEFYKQRLDVSGKTGEEAEALQKEEKIDTKLRLAALRAERKVYYRLLRDHAVTDEIAGKLVREVDLQEARLLPE